MSFLEVRDHDIPVARALSFGAHPTSSPSARATPPADPPPPAILLVYIILYDPTE